MVRGVSKVLKLCIIGVSIIVLIGAVYSGYLYETGQLVLDSDELTGIIFPISALTVLNTALIAWRGYNES